jgi:hypothetical protein
MIKFVTPDRCLLAVATMICASEQLPTRDGKEQAVKIVRVFDEG